MFQDVKKEKGKPETQESQVKEPESSNQINNQMSESVEFAEEKPLSEDPLDVNEADEDVANAEADIDQSDEETTEKDNEISYEDNTDSEEFYESTDQVEINGDNNEELGAMQAVENDTVEEVDIQNESFDSLGEETDLDRLNEMESIIDIRKKDIDIFKEVHEETEDDDQIANGDTEEVTDAKKTRSVKNTADTILNERKGHVFDVETATPTLSVSTSVGELKHDIQAISKQAERKEVTEELNKEGDTLQTDG